MKIPRFVIALVVCGSVVPNVPAQRKSVSRASDVRISKRHPTVYITFERIGKREPVRLEESNAGVWLRLHNNTRWKIHLQAYGLSSTFLKGNEKEVGLYYEVGSIPKPRSRLREVGVPASREDPGCEVPLLMYGDLRSGIYVASGDSIVFSVAREHLCKNLYVAIAFRYAWQPDGDESEHKVKFYGLDVPEITN
jgi:hypothetical protein